MRTRLCLRFPHVASFGVGERNEVGDRETSAVEGQDLSGGLFFRDNFVGLRDCLYSELLSGSLNYSEVRVGCDPR